mmetsp:Transcript_2711/g.4340  ORF Transcript_2711/g.4340 Transcript_2711/m.4340 type:complete len:305 (-) Transcript_2711:336-1250(-)
MIFLSDSTNSSAAFLFSSTCASDISTSSSTLTSPSSDFFFFFAGPSPPMSWSLSAFAADLFASLGSSGLSASAGFTSGLGSFLASRGASFAGAARASAAFDWPASRSRRARARAMPSSFCFLLRKISSSNLPNSCNTTPHLSKLQLPLLDSQPVMRPDETASLYIRIISPMAPSWMSNEGRCGRKSFPAKKQKSTKSSITASWSYGKQKSVSRNSLSRYSRTMFIWMSLKGGQLIAGPFSSASPSRIMFWSCSCFCLSCSADMPLLCGFISSSRRMEKCGSCVARANMIRSASLPWMQCRVLGL